MTKPIELKSGGYRAVIDPVGASCIAFSHPETGISVLHADEERILTGMPPIFPLNRIDGGRFVCGGIEYRFPINEPSTNCALHGTLFTTPFTVTEQDDARVVLRYESGGAYIGFPQDFSVTAVYTLDGGTLTQTITIENRAGNPLPVLFGVHTTFAIPFCPDSSAADVCVGADLAASLTLGARNLTVGRAAPDGVMDALCAGNYRCGGDAVLPITRQFAVGPSGFMTLTDTRAGVCVRYRADAAFTHAMIYSPGGDFFCCEPQTCAVNAPNLPSDSPDAVYPTLDAGQSVCLTSVMEIVGI